MNLRIGTSRKDEDTFGSHHFRPMPQTPEWGEHRQRDCDAIVEDEIMKLVRRVFIRTDVERAPAIVAFCGVDEGAGCSWVCTEWAKCWLNRCREMCAWWMQTFAHHRSIVVFASRMAQALPTRYGVRSRFVNSRCALAKGISG